jgi:hypothetical protein
MAIKTIVDFITEIKQIPKSVRNEYYFRGHSDISFELKPSIYRQNFIRNEDKLFKETILRTPNEFINERTALEKLVKMQHYGLPTRILDLTTNPLVALYFACNENLKSDGEVLVFRIPKRDVKFYDSDTVSILANIAKRPYSFKIDNLDSRNIKEFNAETAIAYLLHEIKDEKPHFLSIIDPDDFERVVAVKVKLNNTRIVKQHGAFLIFGINGEKKFPAVIPENWRLNVEIKGIDLTIDRDSKDNILNDLDALGINESTLFPELQNQATYLKRQFR